MYPQHDKKNKFQRQNTASNMNFFFCRIVLSSIFVLGILGKKFKSPNKGSDYTTTCLNALPLSYGDSRK